MAESPRGGAGGGEFDCNICLDPVTEPVVSLCGHLFCWPCLHRWLVARPQAPSCPVCKGFISEDSLVPVFGRADRGDALPPGPPAPPRPSGRRLRERAGQPLLLLGGLSISIGVQPGVLGDDGSGLGVSLGDLAQELQDFLEQLEIDGQLGPLVSRTLLWIALIFGLWLLIV